MSAPVTATRELLRRDASSMCGRRQKRSRAIHMIDPSRDRVYALAQLSGQFTAAEQLVKSPIFVKYAISGADHGNGPIEIVQRTERYGCGLVSVRSSGFALEELAIIADRRRGSGDMQGPIQCVCLPR